MTLHDRDAILSERLGACWPHEPLLDALKLPNEAAVLDVGAGNGDLLRMLRGRGHAGPVLAVDLAARPDVPAGDAHDLPFPPATFDVVLFVRLFAHLDAPAQALQEAARVLRPGGRLVLAANGPRHLEGLSALVGETPERDDALLSHLTHLKIVPHSSLLRRAVTLRAEDAAVLCRTPSLHSTYLPGTWEDTLELVVHTLQPAS